MILSGYKPAEEVKNNIKKQASSLFEAGFTPRLAILLANDQQASAIYIKKKLSMCQQLGVSGALYKFSNNDRGKVKLMQKVKQLNGDKKTHGILCQLPLPEIFNAKEIAQAITPLKDVDCFNPQNLGKLFYEANFYLEPCTPKAIIKILDYYKISPKGKRVVIIGRSLIVGRTLSLMLLRKNVGATVTVCHSMTQNLKSVCLSADIIICAVGKAHFLTAEYVKEGAVIIDVGINRLKKSGKPPKTVGDVDFDNVKKIASSITPVPGGVGPMTVMMLMENLIAATKHQVVF